MSYPKGKNYYKNNLIKKPFKKHPPYDFEGRYFDNRSEPIQCLCGIWYDGIKRNICPDCGL